MSVNNHFTSKRVIAMRKELEDFNDQFKRDMLPGVMKLKYVSEYVRQTNSGLMMVMVKALKEEEYISLSLIVSVQNYINVAFHNAIKETDDFSDFLDIMIDCLKGFELKIQEQDAKPKIAQI